MRLVTKTSEWPEQRLFTEVISSFKSANVLRFVVALELLSYLHLQLTSRRRDNWQLNGLDSRQTPRNIAE